MLSPLSTTSHLAVDPIRTQSLVFRPVVPYDWFLLGVGGLLAAVAVSGLIWLAFDWRKHTATFKPKGVEPVYHLV